MRRLFAYVPVLLFLLATCFAAPVPAPKVIDLTSSDGTVLKATYFSAGKPGPGVLLLHQCDQQRKVWAPLGEALAAAGINTLTFDYRGYGESGGPPNKEWADADWRRMTTEVWPKDFDVAYEYLLGQPGVDRARIGAGGASCGVDNSVQVARRHPEIKALMLLSGETNRDGRLFLQSKKMPIFTAAADDDQYRQYDDLMTWFVTVSENPASRYQRYATGRHGAEMFPVHPELPGMVAQWFAAVFSQQPKKLPKTNGKPWPAETTRMLAKIDGPGGAAQAEKELAQARQRDPKAQLFPESIVNFLGYERVQLKDTAIGIEILELNATAYPDSANVYDSLADAYLADGKKDLALENAKKALDLLAKDTSTPEQRKKDIRESAEKKVKELQKAE